MESVASATVVLRRAPAVGTRISLIGGGTVRECSRHPGIDRRGSLTADPWSRVQTTYEVGQVRTGRVTRLVEFGAFVELEPGIEGLAHASTFAPMGRSDNWSTHVSPGMTAEFEIV